MSRRLIALIPVVLLSSILVAQQPAAQKARDPQRPFTIPVDVQLVQIPVSVQDKDGKPVDGLTKENFQVYEDKALQTISFFKHEDVPVSLGLVIDNSGSMRNKRERVNISALSFARESNPEDETFIVNFDDSAYLEQEFTGSIGDLMDALDNLDTRGETALYDAVYLSVDHVVKQGHKDKKAILLVSDGVDNTSKYKYEEVIKILKESQVTLYAIGLLEEDGGGGLFGRSPVRKARDTLTKFAEATGGAAYFPKSIDDLEELCRHIAHDLRNHYTIGYTPTNNKQDGTWREIRVNVTPPKSMAAQKITVPRYKNGYFAPNPPSNNR